jgi:type II secretory pathway component PulM
VAGYLIILIVLAVVFTLITGPLRAARHDRSDRGVTVADLQAARDAKYQEIRDAEMDMRTDKLSDEDYASIDRTLRAEAIEILHRLDEAEAADAEADVDAEDAGSDPTDRRSSLPSAP